MERMIPDTFTLRGTTRSLTDWLDLWEAEPPRMSWEEEVSSFIREFFTKEHLQVDTSGTTGPPRTLTVERARMVASARMTLDALRPEEGGRALLCLPARYIAGKMMIVRAVVGGLDLHPIEPAALPVIEGSYSLAAMTPHQAALVLQRPHGREKLSRIRHLLLGGGPLPPALEKELATLPTDIRHTYGMTETLSHVALRSITGPHRSPWFTPLPGVRVTTNDQGCLVIEAPALTRNPVETRDLAVTDDKGRFRITGRLDHLINTGGVKVSPETVEEKLAPFLPLTFFITGTPDEMLGEQITLIIESPPLDARGKEQIRQALNKLRNRIHRPRKIIRLERFLYTPTQKIQRDLTRGKALKVGEELQL